MTIREKASNPEGGDDRTSKSSLRSRKKIGGDRSMSRLWHGTAQGISRETKF